MTDTFMLSTLPKTWIFDVDGTLVKHNGYKTDGADTLLSGVKEYIDAIPADDFILLLTSRKETYREETVRFLEDHQIRFDQILFDMPMGERIIVNDKKPSGINMAVAVNTVRDMPVFPTIKREL